MKKVNITINRADKKQKQESVAAEPIQETVQEPLISEEPVTNEAVVEEVLSAEDLYAKELGFVLDGYSAFTKAYKEVSKMMMNPIKMRKQAGAIYERLSRLSQEFNHVIATFKERALPPEDLQEIHGQLMEALHHFEVYNNEFPDLMRKGNFKRINEVSRGLDTGHKGIKAVFEALEERENQKQSS